MLSRIAIILFIIFISLAPATQVYANYHCAGVPLRVDLSGSGETLLVNNGFGMHTLCSLTQQHPQTIADQTICRAWYAGLLASKMANSTVTISYSDSTGKDNSACSQIGNWVIPEDPVYHISF